jgi:hypothetical protein
MSFGKASCTQPDGANEFTTANGTKIAAKIKTTATPIKPFRSAMRRPQLRLSLGPPGRNDADSFIYECSATKVNPKNTSGAYFWMPGKVQAKTKTKERQHRNGVIGGLMCLFVLHAVHV